MRQEPKGLGANMAAGRQPVAFDAKKPLHGDEYFFSNIMVKVYQIPMLFMNSSEQGSVDQEGTFIVLVYEKIIKKRVAKAKNDHRI